jgi:Mg2+ and Co2+ transporter CorA
MGINLGGMPGVDNKYAFWVVVLPCLAITAGLSFMFRARKRL